MEEKFRVFCKRYGPFDLIRVGVGCGCGLVQVQEEESNVRKARNSEDVASGSKPIDNDTQVELQIRCSGYPTIKKTFSAGIYMNRTNVIGIPEALT